MNWIPGSTATKWVVLAAYLLYVLIWLLLNRYLELFLRQRGADDPAADLVACHAGWRAGTAVWLVAQRP